MRATFLALCCAMVPLCGQEVYSWHTLNVSKALSKRVEVNLLSRTRIRQSFQYLVDTRAGMQLSLNWRAFELTTGYYYEPNQPLGFEWQPAHRLVSLATRTFTLTPRFTAEPRVGFERFFTPVRGNFNRYRAGVRWDYGRNSGPYLTNEIFLVASGIQAIRQTAGWRFLSTDRWEFEAGYLFDERNARWGGRRHALVTILSYNLGD